MVALQGTLTGWTDPHVGYPLGDLERVELGLGAWVEIGRSWIHGDSTLFDIVEGSTTWHSGRRPMYDRIVEVPRLTARLPRDGPVPEILLEARSRLSDAYGQEFSNFGLALYRNGSDSVAPHGDKVARDLSTSVMATISLGTPRRLLLTPAGGGRSRCFHLGTGDLFVMGGTIQRTWQHSIPKTSRDVGPRICVMLRPAWAGGSALAEPDRDVYD